MTRIRRLLAPGILAPLVMLLLALGLRIAEPGPIRRIQLSVFDAYQRLHPRPYQPVPVRIVDLDEESLARVGQWPWPRTQVAELIDRLTELGAAVIALDVVFAEPDRTSPGRLLPLWQAHAGHRELGEAFSSLPDHDDLLARSFERTQVVTGFVLTGPDGGERVPLRKAGFSWGGSRPHEHLPDHATAVASLPRLEAAAVGNGSINSAADVDGVHRRVPIVLRSGDRLLPSLAAEALRVAVGSSTYLVKSAGASGELDFGGRSGIARVRIAPGVEVPTDASGHVWLHFTRAEPERMVPAWQVLEGPVDASRIEGHIVLLGTSAVGLRDQRITPLDAQTPGVVVHAELIEQVLLEHFLVRPDWATGAEVLALAVLGVLLTLLTPRAGALASALLGGAALAGIFGLSWWAFTHRLWVFDPVFPAVGVAGVFLAGSLTGYLRTEAEKRQVRSAFGRYLDPSLVEELARDPERLRLGGEMREMTLLFADVRGFTALSERLEPENLVRVVNRLMTPLSDLILEHRGTIDKYMGDAVMAFWNAPLDDPDHARHACEAALRIIQELERIDAALAHEAEQTGGAHSTLRIGVGLNTGMCCVGNMGSERRFDYSVISDVVNLASRLEGQTKTYGVPIVLGENTQAQVKELACLELDMVRVVGKEQPVRIFGLLGHEAYARSAAFAALQARHACLLAAYRRQDWDEAEREIQECLDLGPQLGELYTLYHRRVEALRRDPPGVGWDAVHVATAK